jgi:hypothetical protein
MRPNTARPLILQQLLARTISGAKYPGDIISNHPCAQIIQNV